VGGQKGRGRGRRARWKREAAMEGMRGSDQGERKEERRVRREQRVRVCKRAWRAGGREGGADDGGTEDGGRRRRRRSWRAYRRGRVRCSGR
jgi:hypothetical protein